MAGERVPFVWFVDAFLLRTGVNKVSAVREAKEGLHPERDFYKPLRERIVQMHQKGGDGSVLDGLLTEIQDERKKRFYPADIAGYRRFLDASKPEEWIAPPKAPLQIGNLELDVQPDLGLVIGGRKHLLLLQFGQRRSPAPRVSALLNIMYAALRPVAPDATFGVLDVQNARLHTLKAVPNPRLHVLLRGEGAAFEAICGAV